MESYSTRALADVLDAFASSEPVPGGGSAAALAGAVGVSLLVMVAGIDKTRNGTPEEMADLAEASARLRPLRDRLATLIDRDSESYRAVLAAFKLPKSSDDEKGRRRETIQGAFKGATDVPLETMRECQQALRGAVVVARCGLRSAATDVAVAVELLMAAVRGSSLNVRVNLAEVTDRDYAARVEAERQALEADSALDAERARAAATA